MTLEEYKTKYNTDDAAPGWDAISNHVETFETAERHYASIVKYSFGGKDPIDGTSVYDCTEQEPHLHFVTYGMSELYYNEEAVGNDFSRWGFEFTFRLKPFADDKGEDPAWVINLMNNLARYVYDNGRWFEENHFMPTNSPIRLNTETDIVGLIFVLDPILGKIQTPHGEVAFLQMVGITQQEIDRLLKNPKTSEVEILANELRKSNPLLITDLNRKSI